VRLPREFRFKGDKVRIRRVGKSVLLEPLADDPEAWLAELKKIPADAEFMKERRQPKTPKRAIFK
jgi:antitoxin VapB